LETRDTLIIKNDIADITSAIKFFSDFSRGHDLPELFVNAVSPVFDEILTNIIFYGYPDEEEHLIEITFDYRDKRLTLIFTDEGQSFNPLVRDAPDRRSPLGERKLGGLGISLVKKIMDGVEYERHQDNNVLTLTKTLVSTNSNEGPHDAIPN
jgi:anti-sigma regulatory factor (Ser/Thr protein kinase)